MSEQPSSAPMESATASPTPAAVNRTRIAAWAVTRILALLVWALLAQHVVGDVNYYWRKISALADAGLTNTLIEYPTPVVALLGLPWLIGGGSQYIYVVLFVAAMIGLDAWLFRLLLRRPRNTWAAWTWILAAPALGPLSFLRFDMIPAVLAGLALLWAAKRPTSAGAAIGVGAAMKLWPALLLPALFGGAQRVRAITGFAVAGVGLAVYSLIVGGWDRLLSPLTWQSDRGLQVESVWVVPALFGRLIDPDSYSVEMSKYQAFEVFGPLTDPMLTVATVSTWVGGLFIIALAIRCWRSPGFELRAAAWVMLAVTAVMIVTNKTFSPQYMLWLAGPAAVLALDLPAGRVRRREDRARLVAALGVVVLCALTQVIYPFLYDPLVANGTPTAATTVVTVLLAVRNLAVLLGTVWVCHHAWRSVRHARDAGIPGDLVG